MPDVVAIPLTGSLKTAQSEQTRMQDSKIVLIKNPLVANPDYVYDAADKADFTGYADADIATWGEVFLDPEGGYSFQSYASWSPTGTTTTNTIYGFVVLDNDLTCMMVVSFGNPAPMVDTLSFCAVIAKFNFGG